ncbi:hypothetical protein IKN40_01800 [bacterium]|nr:hypothetical protein [bacterium]
MDTIIGDSLSHPKYNHYFLLDDNRFHFFRFDIYREFSEPMKMADLDAIVSDRIDYLKTITKEELLFPVIDNIYVD